ncbi:MAG: hypothetical protein RIS94_601 [Pseudomonadota bacterium]
METLLVAQHGPVRLLTINRPHVRNALDAATSSALDAAITDAEADDATGAVIVTGTGPHAFCSGMDLKEAARIGPGHGLVPGRGFGGITERTRTKPLIACVNGGAVAGGFEIALACDMIFAADHATFGLSEVKRGMFAFAGGIQRLAGQVPRATALSLILTGEAVSARRLYELGVVTEVVPAENLEARCLDVVTAMLDNSWAAIRDGLKLYELAAGMDIATALRVGNAWGKAALTGREASDGIAAYVHDKTISGMPERK